MSVKGFINLQAGRQCLSPRILSHDWPAQKFLLKTLDIPLALVELGAFGAHVILQSRTNGMVKIIGIIFHGGMEKLDDNWG